MRKIQRDCEDLREDLPSLLLIFDLLLQENGIFEQFLGLTQDGRGPFHGPHRVQSMLRVAMRAIELLMESSDLGPTLNRGRQGLTHVLGQAIQGQRGLVGADVQVLRDALARSLDLVLELRIHHRLNEKGRRWGRR